MGRPPGRPPLGKRAMSGAERQRRYLDRLLRAQGNTAEVAALQAQLAQAIAELEAGRNQSRGENATLKAENATLKAEVARLQAAAADAQQRRAPDLPRPRTPEDWAALKAQVTAKRKA